MKTVSITIATIVTSLSLGLAHAEENHSGHHSSSEHQMKMPENSGHSAMNHAEMEMTEGVIKRVDANSGKVTLKHGEIKSHQMPPMTMVFKVASPEMLNGMNKGDEVKFMLDGEMNVTHIEKK